jgi:hypothetical protein
MNQQFQNLELSTLIDILAAYTTDYYKMETEGEAREKLKKYRDLIDELQLEIESRTKTQSNTIRIGPAINFTKDHT